MKPINEMTKKELLIWAEEQGFVLSSVSRLKRSDLERALRRMMQERNRKDQEV